MNKETHLVIKTLSNNVFDLGKELEGILEKVNDGTATKADLAEARNLIISIKIFSNTILTLLKND